MWPEKKNSKKISLHLYIGMFITYIHDVLWINPLQEDNFSQKIDLSPATSKVRHMKLSPYIYNKPRKCHIPAIQCTLMIVQILVHSKMLLIIKITFHARHSNHLAAGGAKFYLGMYICIEKNLLLRNRSDRKAVTHIEASSAQV